MTKHNKDSFYKANSVDLEFVKCPLCNKDIVEGRWHACKNVLQSDEYINHVKGIRLLWLPIIGWRSYDYPEGDVIESLSFSEVFNWVTEDKNFIAQGDVEMPGVSEKNLY